MLEFLHNVPYKTYVGLFLSSLFAGYWLVPRITWLSRGLGAYAKRATVHGESPLLGGLVIGVPFILGISLLMMLRNDVSHHMYMVPLHMRGLFIGSCLAVALGLIQDLMHLKLSRRLPLQIGVAATAHYYTFTFGIAVESAWAPAIEVALTVLWILGTINLLDLFERAGPSFTGFALIVVLVILGLSFILDQYRTIVVCCLLAGGLLSILSHDASIRPRLGSTGTYLLGFVLSTTSLQSRIILDSYGLIFFAPGIALVAILVWTRKPLHLKAFGLNAQRRRSIYYFRQAYAVEIGAAEDADSCWSALCRAAGEFGYNRMVHHSSVGVSTRDWRHETDAEANFSYPLEYSGGTLTIYGPVDPLFRPAFTGLLEVYDRKLEKIHLARLALRQNKLRLVLVNRYFAGMSATGQIAEDLAQDLAKDADITVLTGSLSYDGHDQIPGRNEFCDAIHICRVPATHFGRGSALNRAIDFIFFYVFTATWIIRTRADRYTHILVFTDPPLIAAVGWLARLLKGWKYAYDIQDLYPETALALGVMKRGVPFKICRAINRKLLSTSDLVITIGRKMAEHIREIAGISCPIEVIPNWAHGAIISPSSRASNPLLLKLGLRDVYTVIYAGNMGLAQEVNSLVDLICRFKGREDVQFIFMGGGVRRDVIKRAVTDQALSNVHLLPYQRRSELAMYLGLADIGVVTLAVELEGLAIPTRTYSYLAAGLPLLGIAHIDSELAQFATEGLGAHFEPDSIDSIVYFLEQEIREGSRFNTTDIRNQFEARFDRPLQTRKYLQALRSID